MQPTNPDRSASQFTRALAIVNPATRACRRLVDDVLAECRRRGVAAEVAATRGPGDATLIARDAVATADFDLFVSVGGDGTAMEIVSGMAASRMGAPTPPLAVVPAGTANILARTFGIPMRSADAIH